MTDSTGSLPESGSTSIAVDAMGADFDPALAISACIEAMQRDPDLTIRVFGDPDALAPAERALPEAFRARLRVIGVSGFVEMDASPARALRRSRDSSMARALADLADGTSRAMVSAGNTGALMALARTVLGTLPGVERPALMTAFPVDGGHAWVLDLGANIGVDADRLLEFALLGSAAVEVLAGRRPRVGLLNIGRESTKGPDVVREASRRLSEDSSLDYVGFVEGHDVFAGRADVVVCDGFAGNVLLKAAEGAIRMLLGEMAEAASRPIRGMALRGSLKSLAERYDPGRHNGASLLGIDGIVIKSHAHADAAGVARAIELAALEARRELVPAIERKLWSEA